MARSSTRDFIREVKPLHYATVKHISAGGLQWLLQNFLCFEHIKVNARSIIFYFIKCSCFLFYITFNWFTFIKYRFYIHSIYSVALNIIILIILPKSILRGAWKATH